MSTARRAIDGPTEAGIDALWKWFLTIGLIVATPALLIVGTVVDAGDFLLALYASNAATAGLSWASVGVAIFTVSRWDQIKTVFRRGK